MKKNFKKSLAVLLAMLMLVSVVSVTAFAATYTITFQATSNADKGQTQTATRTFSAKGETIILPTKEELTFTREGYDHIGWSTGSTGATKHGDFGAEYKTTKAANYKMYPAWKAKVFEVTYTAGAFGVGADVVVEATYNKAVRISDALFTREGYTQVGWALSEGGEQEYKLNQTGVKFEADTVLYPVWVKDVYNVETSINSADFGSVCVGYVTPEKKTLVITNNSNVEISYTVPTSANYTIVTSGSSTLDEGESFTVTIQPKANLAVGMYNETLNFVSNKDVVSFSIPAKFSVNDHAFVRYESNGDATYSQDGTKTAECLNGCGTKDTLPDIGSMKVYGAEYNTVVGLSDEYIYHRTVRFTAYGSGSDYNEAETVDGALRYVPVSWYVNDDFNGTFTDSYDVNFTHTIFGSYTLTIDYVQEEFDGESGTWVPTGETDQKTFEYSVGATAEEKQEIQRPQTILGILFGLFEMLFSLLGIGA